MQTAKKQEIEDLIKEEPTFENIMHLAYECSFQLEKGQNTTFMILQIRHDNIYYIDVCVTCEGVFSKRWIKRDVIVNGVQHCMTFKRNKIFTTVPQERGMNCGTNEVGYAYL